MARLRELAPGCRVITRSGFSGTVVGTARLADVNVVLVNLDLLTGEERNPVVVFPEHLTTLPKELAMEQAAPSRIQAS
jgi:hypothetical protein